MYREYFDAYGHYPKSYYDDEEYDIIPEPGWDIIGDDYSLVDADLDRGKWYALVKNAFAKDEINLKYYYLKIVPSRSGAPREVPTSADAYQDQTKALSAECKRVYQILFNLLATDPTMVNAMVPQIHEELPIKDTFEVLKSFMEITIEINEETERTIGKNIFGGFTKWERQRIPIGTLIICLLDEFDTSRFPWDRRTAQPILNDQYNILIRKFRRMNEEKQMKKGKSGKLQLQQKRKTAKKESASFHRRCCAACSARLRLGMRPRLVCRACTYL